MANMDIRLAKADDLDDIARIYDAIHDEEAAGRCTTGWLRGIYPVRATAEAALQRGDLYVLTAEGQVTAAAIINQQQVDCYAQGNWSIPAAPDKVLVLHTLVVDPAAGGHGMGRAFVAFYEAEARRRGCIALRMDTNARNTRARGLYARLGYREAGIVPTVFNGIPNVGLVLLEKAVG